MLAPGDRIVKSRDFLALYEICLVKLNEHVTSLGFIMDVSHAIRYNTCDMIVLLISGGGNGILRRECERLCVLYC